MSRYPVVINKYLLLLNIYIVILRDPENRHKWSKLAKNSQYLKKLLYFWQKKSIRSVFQDLSFYSLKIFCTTLITI